MCDRPSGGASFPRKAAEDPLYVPRFEAGGGQAARAFAMSTDSVSAALEPSAFGDSPLESAEPRPTVAPAPGSTFVVERIAMAIALLIVGAIVGYALLKTHRATDSTERDRLHAQARVIGENVGQQLDGINRALASVRDDYLVMPPHQTSTLLSARLKVLCDAIPGVRSMVVLDAEGTVVATSVDALLGRDFADRDYFRAPKAAQSPATLHVASPYKTSLDNYTIVFGRAIVAPNGAFAGAAVAALEPEYFEVLMRSVLYAPDMWVSLGHSDGKVFVTMPRNSARLESDWQPPASQVTNAQHPSPSAVVMRGAIGGSDEARLTALRALSPAELHLDKPLVIAVSRAEADVFRAWRQQAMEYTLFFAVLSAAAAFGLHRGQLRRRAFARLEASAARERRHSAEQLELALQGADLGLWDWDLRGDRFEHNQVTRQQLGYEPGEIGNFGGEWHGIIHPVDRARMLGAVEAHFRGETAAYECEFRVRHKNGHWVWLLSRGKVVERDEFGIAVRMAGTHMDLTRRKATEAKLERSAELLKQTGALAQIGGWELDLATMRLDWTEQVYRIHELEPGIMPTLENAIDFYAPDAQPTIRAAVAAGVRHGTPWDLELPFVTAKGNPRWVRAQGIAAMEEGRPVRLLGAFQDITEKMTTLLEMHRLNEQLTRLSTTDALTEVGNRRMFDQTLRIEWARAARRGEHVGLLMIDIDHFKEYNDHYGHPAGDACLRQVARMVGQSMRRGGELVARYGGEEFALLLPGADLEDTRRAAERCAQIVAEAKIEHRASATSAWLTISIGAASQVAVVGTDGSALVETADAALYRAKRCGRARIEF
jgi:diguanylate cyclase (GGDEF)-like protein/PAS domain S-box-containing protein